VQAVTQGLPAGLPRLQGIRVNVGSPLVPQQALAAPLRPGRLAQRTTQLLPRLHQTRQPHPGGKHHGEGLRAVAARVLALIALLFQRIARLLGAAPASPCPRPEPIPRAWVAPSIGAPAPLLDWPVRRRLPRTRCHGPAAPAWRHCAAMGQAKRHRWGLPRWWSARS
jgi:hypothetical protein